MEKPSNISETVPFFVICRSLCHRYAWLTPVVADFLYYTVAGFIEFSFFGYIYVCTSGLRVLSQSLFEEVSRRWFGCWARGPAVRKTLHIPVQPLCYNVAVGAVLLAQRTSSSRAVVVLLWNGVQEVALWTWEATLRLVPSNTCAGFITWKGCLVGAWSALSFMMPLVRGTQLSSNFIS